MTSPVARPPRVDPFAELKAQGPYRVAASLLKLARDFEATHGRKATAIYLGKREWPDALECMLAMEPLLTHQAQAVGAPPEFLGIKFYRAAEAAHFEVY